MNKIKFTCYSVRWFDKVNGNTYHSVRITNNETGETIVAPIQYGYGDHYRQTAIETMVKNAWIDQKYEEKNYMYERENNYPIHWIVSDGLKRDCIANGKL